MFKPKKFPLSLSLSLSLSLFFLAFPSLFAQETITITTYYPSPYGSYGYLHTDKFGVGDNDGSGGPTEADIPITSGNVWIAGNVGIGTTNPGEKLHVRSDATTWQSVHGNLVIDDSKALAQGVGGGILFEGVWTNVGEITYSGGIDTWKETATHGEYGFALRFHTRPNGGSLAERMRITSEGNVGIGTTTPTSTLHLSSTDTYIRLSGTQVAHGITSIVPTDVFGYIGNPNTASGGMFVNGFQDVGTLVPLQLGGTFGSTDPTDTVSAVVIEGYKSNGSTGRAALANAETILGVNNAGGTNLFVIQGSGNVGIGTTGPGAKLEEYHGTTYAAGDGIRSSGYYPNFQLYSTGVDAGTRNWVILAPWNAWGDFQIRQSNAKDGDPMNAGTARFVIDPSGNVGIGTVAPGAGSFTGPNRVLEIAGAASGVNAPVLILNRLFTGQVAKWEMGVDSDKSWRLIDTTGGTTPIIIAQGGATGTVSFAAWTYNSDRRLKENIQYLESINATDIIGLLKPATFDYINGAKNEAGFIAQDVQEILPNLVTTDSNGMLGLKTTELIPYMVKAVQEQQDRIQKQQNQLQEQQREIENLKAEIASLKGKVTNRQ